MKQAKEFFKAHASKGLVDAARKAKQEWLAYRQHCSALKKVGPFLQLSEKKLNLGCGSNPKLGWINIDLLDSRADLQLDLREKWPFADNSVTHIYSEHVFEYFEFPEEVDHFLSEAHRILRGGGLFDVGVPDTEWPMHAYGDPGNPYWLYSKTWHPEGWCETQLDHINYHFRHREPGLEVAHKYAWDQETLTRILLRFGFTQVARREFDPALDAESRKIGTLYMRAVKSS